MYIQDTSRIKGHSLKLHPLWTGPAVIVKRLGDVLYRVQRCKKTQTFHYDRLKPCKADSVPIYIQRFRGSLVAADASAAADGVTASDESNQEEPLRLPSSLDTVDPGETPMAAPDPPPPTLQCTRTRSGRASKLLEHYNPGNPCSSTFGREIHMYG